MALIKVNLIAHDLEYLQDKFGFSDEDMQNVPQAPFKYLREIFKDTAFRTSQYKMLNKLIYTNPGTPVFSHYITARRWYAPRDMAKTSNSEI